MYIDAILDKKSDVVKVVERVDGKRVYKDHQVEHYFYVSDKDGKYKNIYNEPVRKISPRSRDEKQKLIRAYASNKLWESDINPVLRCLENNYLHKPEPNAHVAFFDIETDFDMENGYSAPEDALNKITSIAVYLQWMDRMVCISIPPPTLTLEEATEIADQVGDCIVVANEIEMLDIFLTLIEDADILSGWNSDQFDILYIINRITRIMCENDTRRLCLWDKLPIKKEVMSKEDEEEDEEVLYYTYVLSGRVHLDYMQLYKKYTYEQKQSYSLDNISFLELGERKVQYEGTLDQLYKNDFKKFLEYNIQDTYLLHRLDKQLQYISLANSIAHNNVVLFSHTMGTVSTTEQAIIVEAHANFKVVPNRRELVGDPKAAGGWTPKPKPGLHYWIANTDMNSLYPSAIRALNMSPETLVAQIRLDRTRAELKAYMAQGKKYKFTNFWNGRFNVNEMEYVYNKDNVEVMILDMADGKSYEMTGAEIYSLVFDSGNPWSISANGTIFRNDFVGVIPSLLARWYSERKQMQAKYKLYRDLAGGTIALADDVYKKLPIEPYSDFDLGTCYDETNLLKLVEVGDKEQINLYLNQHKLIVVNGKVTCEDQDYNQLVVDFWDKRQLVRKINLNSVYGGLLNAHHRFFDQRIGQSTTLTGRSICKHMAAKTNEIITGEYDHDGGAIIYGDTDSAYFSAYPTLKKGIESGEIAWNKEIAVQMYDAIAHDVSLTFPAYVNKMFHIPEEYGSVLKSSREMVCTKGLFIKRKRYAVMVFDKEGKRKDKNSVGELKVTGLEIKRSDTPKIVQTFLQQVLENLMADDSNDNKHLIIEQIKTFKETFNSLHPWQKGTPKAVNGMKYYGEIIEKQLDKKKVDGKRTTVPGHVRASIYWNTLREINKDNNSLKILEGTKIVVCKLKVTPDNTLESIAYPIDEPHLPEWFKSLPFDDEEMMQVSVNKKLDNILGALKWDLSVTEPRREILESLFDFNNML